MKVSELINNLQKILDTEGDLEVFRADNVDGEEPVNTVEASTWRPHRKGERSKPILRIGEGN